MRSDALATQAVQLGSAEARASLAGEAATAPELLTLLAFDPAPLVRCALAANPATPALADRLLAVDAEDAVRAALARRLAGLAPQLGGLPGQRLAKRAAGTLALLAADAAVTVRAAIAAAICDLPDAPRALILRLARDTEVSVADPVIRLSPLLTEDDLLALVADPPGPGTRCAVARRDGLGELVADALAASNDVAAVTALLGNSSAAIREATLDVLVAGAAGRPSWQDALVRRARLSGATLRTLAGLVAEHLLAPLAARDDLPTDLATELHARVAERLAADAGPAPDERMLIAACRDGDRETVRRALMHGAGVSAGRLDAALALRSGRAIVGLCHRAGWSPALAVEVQAVLGGLPPEELVPPRGDGGWALGEAELLWQAALLDGLPE